MSSVINFLTSNWDGILAVIAAAIVVVDKVVKFTPSTKDDEIVAKVEEVLKNLGVLKDPPAA